MLGAHSDRLDRSRAQVLSKPFDLEILFRMINLAVGAPPHHPERHSLPET